MPASNWRHIENATILKETDKAFQIETEDCVELWLPVRLGLEVNEEKIT